MQTSKLGQTWEFFGISCHVIKYYFPKSTIFNRNGLSSCVLSSSYLVTLLNILPPSSKWWSAWNFYYWNHWTQEDRELHVINLFKGVFLPLCRRVQWTWTVSNVPFTFQGDSDTWNDSWCSAAASQFTFLQGLHMLGVWRPGPDRLCFLKVCPAVTCPLQLPFIHVWEKAGMPEVTNLSCSWN